MKKWIAVGVAVLSLVGTACVPPGGSPVATFEINGTSIIAVAGLTKVGGTIKNTGGGSAHYSIELLATSGEASNAYAFDVLPGQTAIWQTIFDGTVTYSLVRVTTDPVVVPWVYASVAVTQTLASFGFTTVSGMVTNTGPAAANYQIEMKASSGEVSTGYALNVLPGQTATWQAVFRGDVQVEFVRVTN